MQSGQRVRTSRWAITPSTVDATRNGSTPMSISRVKALGASLVCRVLKTRCPVRDAWMAASAVSMSRISPIRITSGSCRRIDRSVLPNVSPILACVWIWQMPGCWYSTGSSTVMILVVSSLISLSAE